MTDPEPSAVSNRRFSQCCSPSARAKKSSWSFRDGRGAPQQAERAGGGAPRQPRRDVRQRRALDDGRERRASEVQVRAIHASLTGRASERRSRNAFPTHPPSDASVVPFIASRDRPRLRRRVRLTLHALKLAGSTSPSATCPGSRPKWKPPCSRWCAHAPKDVSRMMTDGATKAIRR